MWLMGSRQTTAVARQALKLEGKVLKADAIHTAIASPVAVSIDLSLIHI